MEEIVQLPKLVSTAPRRPGPARYHPRGVLCLEVVVPHPELAHSNTTRFEVASAGGGSIPALVASWEATPALRSGVTITFGIMLWYVDNTGRALSSTDRVTVRRHLLRSAVAEEKWLRQAFVEAADWTNDPTWVPLVRQIAPESATTRKLEGELVVIRSTELLRLTREQWEAMSEEGWVTDDGLKRSATLALGTAGTGPGDEERRTARAALTALGVNLGAARGRGLRGEAYEVMRGAIDSLATRLSAN
jgi:hypothetical protein